MLSKIFKKNVLSSLLCLILITVSTVPSMAETLKSSKLTEEQKDLYYVEYEKIINSVNESEGKNLELERKEDFSDNDWVHPIEFRKRVMKLVNSKVNVVYSKADANAKDEYGIVPMSTVSATKPFTISKTGSIGIEINVSGTFESQYANQRQLFSKVHSINSSKKSGDGTWKQTSYETSFMDGSRTCKVIVAGKYTVSGVTDTKLGTVYFYMKNTGEVY